ncbi:MAG: glycoside hydrolase family 43 protein [Eubacteriales bacterium]|nr:glycoside hydrolase family 43 protein [Eubacteriales bacterium]
MEQIAGYLFVTFAGEGEGEEQIRFSLSRDGLHFRDLNQGRCVLSSETGEKGVRDPFLLRTGEKGPYYLMATDLRMASGRSWEDAVRRGSRSIVVWESEDLVHWMEARLCQVGTPDAGCVWAPEAVYDPEKDAYMVFWASYVNGKHRIYSSYTKDFREFTPAEIYLEKEYDVIDMTIVRAGDVFYRFYKDECNKTICLDAGNALHGEFHEIPSKLLEQLKGVEGPAVIPLNDQKWCLFVDRFAENAGYLPVMCENLESGEFHIMEEGSFDMGVTPKRHGSILALSREEYEVLDGRREIGIPFR